MVTQEQIDRAFDLDAPGMHTIHTARKEGPCQFGRRVNYGPRCCNVIKPGDKYVAGAHDFHAGPWSRERWCLQCVEFTVDNYWPCDKEPENQSATMMTGATSDVGMIPPRDDASPEREQ